MKNTLRHTFIFIVFLSIIYVFIGLNVSVKAYSNEDNLNLEGKIVELFGEKTILNADYLYNFDDEEIFIYSEFLEGGYCIISKDGETILEYSLNGSGPYVGVEKKYYCGPTYYFNKVKNNIYYNNYNSETVILTNEEEKLINDNLELTINLLSTSNTAEIKNINFTYSNPSGNSTPSLDEEGIINATITSASDTKYINNYKYFLSSPGHGVNSTGTCGAVAAQLMLSYHNYYSDRRIISANYLNGGWNNSLGDGNIFNYLNYDNPEENPNACSNPEIMNWHTLGSTGINETDSNTYFNYLVSKIPASATTNQVKNGIIAALDEKNEELVNDISYDIDSHFGVLFSSVNEQNIKNEIDANRPALILMQEYLGGWNHYVVAYGYQNIISPTNGEEYSGFITHFGHSTQYSQSYRINVWINSSWCYSYISMRINHTHNYSIKINNIIDNSKIEIRCEECGHRILDDLYVLSSNNIIDVKYDLIGEITIPSNINGIEVKGIGAEAFKNCRNLQEIIIPNTATNIDSSAFENCSYLQSVTLSSSLVAIGSSAFKGCASLESISIPNSVTHIDTSAFEECSYLQSVTLSNNLIAIGSSAFKGCASLARITIPNTVTNIDTSAFEGCSYLQSVTLSTNLIAIGSSAFKGCNSLESINLPSSINNIGDEAFKNCSSLTSVTVNREISNTTNLGENAFDGCHTNLQIIVPTNRIAEYKNKEYWSSYRNKIIPSEDYTEYEIDCEGSLNYTLTLNSKYNKLYKLNVDCSKSYKINANSLNNVDIIIYDSNMNVVSSDSNTITQFLGCGTYYISFEFNNINDSGIIEIGITLTWLSANIPLSSGINNIKNSMHLNSENIYHCSYEYLNNQGEGFYRFSLNFGNNRILPEGAIKIYSDRNRTTLVSRYTISGINKQAVNDNGENELYLYLPGNSYYYIDIVLPKSTYTLITLTIEEVENKDINYLNRLDSSGFDVIFEDKTSTSYFEKVTISHRSKIELDILTSGTINRNIPIYIFEIQEAPGSRPGDEYSYIVYRLTDSITSINRSPVFTIILNPGTYYIGYSDNLDNASISFSLRRKVNIDLNINGTLVTDPALNQGFPLGSEVTFNDGALLGNTITEGFTRNIYLMVEDRLRDPMSRLEYDWYSSNENVAIVTKYGTVLALNVNENTTVTIYAINKDDPSIVYKKDFVILKETKTEQLVIECNMTYSYSEENGMYTLELDFTNCPYPYIGYYVWDIESFNGISVDMEHYGLIYSTGPGEALLTANYILNMRIFLKIHLTITE